MRRFQHGSHGRGAQQKIDIVEILKILVAMHIAWLACSRFPDAGELCAQATGQHAHLRRYSSARKRTSAVATSMPATGASVRQPGTALTSMTYHSPFGPGSRSIP